MIVGIGIDVVEIDRFSAALDRTPGLRGRIFTQTEQQTHGGDVRRPASLAARFAAKEAAAKALGAPGGMVWTDAEIRTDDTGRPTMHWTGTVRAHASVLGVTTIHVSMSHDAGVASAVVVLERD